MLPFRVYHLEISGKHYLLLPKLNAKQVAILGRRLERKGFSVRRTSILSGLSTKGSIYIDPSGLCWSSVDPEDAVLPAVPDLLSCPKEAIPLAEMEALYLRRSGSKRNPIGKLSTRVEWGTLWDELRASGDCGLTPDERSVALAVLRGETSRLVTESIGEDSAPLVCGRRRYFETSMGFKEVELTLGTAGELRSGRSYLPRDDVLKFGGKRVTSDLEDALKELGEWCFFAPR